MFTFPKSTEKENWVGQGALFKQGLPYFFDDTLGLCFGVSAVWLSKGADFDAQKICLNNEDPIKDVRGALSTYSGYEYEKMLEYAAENVGLKVEGKDTVRKYSADSDDFTSSHFILDILNRREAHSYLIAFCFEGGKGEDEHAIAVSFTDSEKGLLMDPNEGVARYNSRSALCSDLHSLMALYVGPSGHVSAVYLLPYKNAVPKNATPQVEWDDFQGASSFQGASF